MSPLNWKAIALASATMLAGAVLAFSWAGQDNPPEGRYDQPSEYPLAAGYGIGGIEVPNDPLWENPEDYSKLEAFLKQPSLVKDSCGVDARLPNDVMESLRNGLYPEVAEELRRICKQSQPPLQQEHEKRWNDDPGNASQAAFEYFNAKRHELLTHLGRKEVGSVVDANMQSIIVWLITIDSRRLPSLFEGPPDEDYLRALMLQEAYLRGAFDLYESLIEDYPWASGDFTIPTDAEAGHALVQATWDQISHVYPDEDRDNAFNPFGLYRKVSLFWNLSSEYELEGAMAHAHALVKWNHRYWTNYMGETLPTAPEAHQLLARYERMDPGMQGFYQIYVLATEVLQNEEGSNYWPGVALRVLTFDPSDWHPLCGCGTTPG